MSKDPFEELFGPLADDAGNGDTGAGSAPGSDAPTAPLPAPRPNAPVAGVRRGQGEPAERPAAAVSTATAPMPARQRLAHEQAERLQTTSQSSTGRGGATSSRLPWIIVGAVAIIAIIVSIVVVNVARSADNTPEAATDTTTSAPETSQSEPATPSPTTPEKPKPQEKPKDEVPQVEVGPTNTLPIGPWSVTSELSQRLGSASFNIPDGVNLELTSDLLSSFPESCAAMRTEWGATRLDDGTFQVRKPAESCAEATELYDTVWGLMDAWVGTIKPQ